MKAPLRLRARSYALLFISVIVFAGCGDSPFASLETDVSANAPSKMRQSHLYSTAEDIRSGKVLERFAQLVASNDFVLSTSGVELEMAKVLERYQNLDGVTVKGAFSRAFVGFAVHVDENGKMTVPKFLEIVEKDSDIKWIEPDPRFTTRPFAKSKDLSGGQELVSSLYAVKAEKSSTLPGNGSGSVNVDIYIIDSGINNSDLNVVERVDFTTSVEQDKGLVLDRTRVLERLTTSFDKASDLLGHGTHVAGIAAAIDDKDGLVGAAPGARIHDFRVFDAEGRADMSAVIAALDVIKARMQYKPHPIVVNLSLGADIGTTEYNALDEAVAACVEAGVVVVVAAGNDAIDARTVTPAHVSSAITVGAGNAPFTNYGPYIDIHAPGVDVMSLAPGANRAVQMSGTSMSAPLVAGAAALYLSANPKASPQQVRDAIYNSASSGASLRPATTTIRQLDLSAF